MLEKMYCPYCGQPLSEQCDCEQIATEEAEAIRDAIEERQFESVWQQDVIDMYRYER